MDTIHKPADKYFVMVREALIRKGTEKHKKPSRMRDFILGWQDGLVNVLGIILGMATATSSAKLVLIAGLAATFAESVSMMAVAYTSFKAEADFYKSEMEREKCEMREVPDKERKEIQTIFHGWGFSGTLLAGIVRHVTSNKKRWLDMMMDYELKLSPPKYSPLNIAVIVGISALIGSLIPLAPFMFLPVGTAFWTSIAVSSVFLFIIGVYKAITTAGKPLRSGLEMVTIGMLAAVIGYGIGAILGAAIV